MNQEKIIAELKAGNVESCDWSHDPEKCEYYNGESFSKESRLKNGGVIVTENMPYDQVQDHLKEGRVVLGIHVNLFKKEWKEKHGISTVDEKKRPTDLTSHKVDAKALYDCAKEHPEWFKEIKPQAMKLQYKNFYQMQQAGVAMGLRIWASGTMSEENIKNQKEHLDELKQDIIKGMQEELEKHPEWNLYLDNLPYIGPSLGGGLVAMADTMRFDTASKLRKYAGMAVVNGGSTQRHVKGETGGFNTILKMLLLGRIATQFIKSKGMKVPSEYVQDYTIEKEKIQHREPQLIPLEEKSHIVGDMLAEDVGSMKMDARVYNTNYQKLITEAKKVGKDKVLIKLSPGHIHAMASRKMMTLFLEDYWVITRQLLGYPTTPPYPQSVLQHNHYRPPKYVPEMLQPFEPIREMGWIFNQGKRPWEDADDYIKEKCGKLVEVSGK